MKKKTRMNGGVTNNYASYIYEKLKNAGIMWEWLRKFKNKSWPRVFTKNWKIRS